MGRATPLPEKRSKVLCKLDEIDLENLTPKSLIQTQAVLIQYLKSLKRNRMPDNMKEALKAMKEREIVSDPILEEYNVIKVDSFQRKCLLWSIHWINWNSKIKIKTKFFFVNNISTLLYTLKKKTFFTLLSKVYKKIVEFSFTPAKFFLVFRFWFQLI